MFLAFQGDSFDIADRTFRNVATTWWLSSSESATDVKELIPEFYFLPEFLQNRESKISDVEKEEGGWEGEREREREREREIDYHNVILLVCRIQLW